MEERLVRLKYRETSSRFCLCCFVINAHIFVLNKTAGFGCRHDIKVYSLLPRENKRRTPETRLTIEQYNLDTSTQYVLSLPILRLIIRTLRSEDGDGRENVVEKVFFQSSSRLLQVTNFVKCRQTLLKLNS